MTFEMEQKNGEPCALRGASTVLGEVCANLS